MQKLHQLKVPLQASVTQRRVSILILDIDLLQLKERLGLIQKHGPYKAYFALEDSDMQDAIPSLHILLRDSEGLFYEDLLQKVHPLVLNYPHENGPLIELGALVKRRAGLLIVHGAIAVACTPVGQVPKRLVKQILERPQIPCLYVPQGFFGLL